jgi:hypothetical protein
MGHVTNILNLSAVIAAMICLCLSMVKAESADESRSCTPDVANLCKDVQLGEMLS